VKFDLDFESKCLRFLFNPSFPPPTICKVASPIQKSYTSRRKKFGKYRRFVENLENSEILTTFFVVSAA